MPYASARRSKTTRSAIIACAGEKESQRKQPPGDRDGDCHIAEAVAKVRYSTTITLVPTAMTGLRP